MGTGNPSSIGVVVLVEQAESESLIQGQAQSNIAKNLSRGKVRASLVVVLVVLLEIVVLAVPFEVIHREVRILREIPWIATLLAE
jgi:hypothetical protein